MIKHILALLALDCLSGFTPHPCPATTSTTCVLRRFVFFFVSCILHPAGRIQYFSGMWMQTEIKREACLWRLRVRSPLRVASPLELEIPRPRQTARHDDHWRPLDFKLQASSSEYRYRILPACCFLRCVRANAVVVRLLPIPIIQLQRSCYGSHHRIGVIFIYSDPGSSTYSSP